MNMAEIYALCLSSVSIYKNITEDKAIVAFRKMLVASFTNKDEFVKEWSNFFSALCEKDCEESFYKYVKNLVLYDENSFTLEATKGKNANISNTILTTAQKELQIIFEIATLSPTDILEYSKYKEELTNQNIIDFLPMWSVGKNEEIDVETDKYIDIVTEFNKNNGYGIYAKYRAFIWRNGDICPVKHPDKIKLSEFKEYEYQRNVVLENTRAFLNNKSANNCLLYGDKGTGKSSTVKAILNEHYKDGLRMVEMPKERLLDFPILVDKIASIPMKFIIFIDDLSFQKQDDRYASLKAVLEGGLAVRPDNTLIYATSNRRHLVKENFSERNGDELHRNDTIQESLSLADRFGLAVNFSAPNKIGYLNIVSSLAKQKGIKMEESELHNKAERFALQKGGRSPRIAKQFINAMYTE